MIVEKGGKYYDGFIIKDGESISLREFLPRYSVDVIIDGWYTIEGEKVTEETLVLNNNTHSLYARWGSNDRFFMYDINYDVFGEPLGFGGKTWINYEASLQWWFEEFKKKNNCDSINCSFNGDMSFEEAKKMSKTGQVPGDHKLYISCKK